MNKVMISTFVVGVCLLISAVRSQECGLLRRCGDDCCVLFLGNLRGTCSTGQEGQQCGGTNMCRCRTGLDCEKRLCVAQTTTAASGNSTTEGPAEATTPEGPSETPPPAVTTVAPSSTVAQTTTAPPEISTAEGPAEAITPEGPAEAITPEGTAETTPPAETTVAPSSTDAPEITP